ncbi:DUF1990 domain-containing protein [Brachybacterium sp. FME24]|uniref:DUF1990 domain-containing protein n=1 Tax=Brachybacterium sp. FME24 TaxID=2742605 RepID=UPI001D011EEF|nr:DUF1990 domain-containing protein [Brachybacterium sp. FME24]
MAFPSAPTWWEDRQSSFRDVAREGPTFEGPPFSAEILALLAEVEAAFDVTEACTPGWTDPHREAGGEIRDSLEAEYSRCLDPSMYRILWARAGAWSRVLTARGWADETVVEDRTKVAWVVEPHVDRHRTMVLRPRRAGGQALVLARTAPDDSCGTTDVGGEDAELPGLVIGLGEPAVAVETLPDCGCDACDSGSRDLLEQLDTAILSIVDGSCEVVLTPLGHSQRSSFGASSGSGTGEPDMTVQVSAGPWAEGWTPRPLCPPIDPMDSAWADEKLREAWPTRLLETVIAAFPPPLAARIHRLRPGRTGTATTSRYVRDETGALTVPLDALESTPAGHRRIHRSSVVVGTDFDQARSALLGWTVHRRAGFRVIAERAPLQAGTEVRLRLGIWPFLITAPCRVLRVVDEPDRAGFAYATLPGHPESGIEEFTITRTATGLMRFHLDAVSKPATWYARLGAPVSRLVQEYCTRRYLRALST